MSCRENLASFLVLAAQLLQIHHPSSPLPALLPVSYLPLSDKGVTSRLATSYGYDIDLPKVSGKRQSSSQLG